MLLYCDLNEDGSIIRSLSGKYIVPEKKYDDYFLLTKEEYGELPEDIAKNLDQYHVMSRKLVKKESNKTIDEVIEEKELALQSTEEETSTNTD